MKENLVQTTSIFYNPDNLEVSDEHLLQPSLMDVQELLEREEFNPCRTIHFGNSYELAKINLREFFPDTMFCIIRNVHMNAHFAASMKHEIIFEVPFEEYCIELVTQDLVVLSMDTELGEGDTRQYMVLEGNSYRMLDEFEYEIDGDQVIFEKRKHRLESSEVEEVRSYQDMKVNIYHYPDGWLIHSPSNFLHHKTSSTQKRILLADHNGSYLGFYLGVNEDDTINLHGRRFRMLQRLTLPLAIVVDVEEEEAYILSCVNQTLMLLSDFFRGEYTDIEVINGIAILMEDNRDGQVLNVFTPNHQRIILEPGYKINSSAIGNGLYFQKDDVLVLDNGSLIFTQKLSKHSLKVRGKEVEIPIAYLGEV